MLIPIYVTAKNEEQTIADCLKSLLAAAEHARLLLDCNLQIAVVLDDCTDQTESVACSFTTVRIIHSRGGLVEAQRAAIIDAAEQSAKDFVVFCDADILIEEQTIASMVQTMLRDPQIRACYPRKVPLAPHEQSLVAAALYSYNLNDGFQGKRKYFNGKLFAIRDWGMPSMAELQNRLAKIRPSRFYRFHEGLKIDDIYLSRKIIIESGEQAIVEAPQGSISFRPPETLEGMYQYYKRMRVEWERLDVLFPETRVAHQLRSYDTQAVHRASPRERYLWWFFRLMLQICKLRYAWERFFYERVTHKSSPIWPVVKETKRRLSSGSVQQE